MPFWLYTQRKKACWQKFLAAATGPSYIALGGALVPTGQPPALHPLTGVVSAPGAPETTDTAGAGPRAGARPGAGPGAGAGAWS